MVMMELRSDTTAFASALLEASRDLELFKFHLRKAGGSAPA